MLYTSELAARLASLGEKSDHTSQGLVEVGCHNLVDLLEEANAHVSAMAKWGVTGYVRYRLHQAVTARLLLEWARGDPEMRRLVIGIHPHGQGAEISLFSGYPEIIGDLLDLPDGLRIGLTADFLEIVPQAPPDFLARVKALRTDLDTEDPAVLAESSTMNLGWADQLGCHVEYYDVERRLYVRYSQTGRTGFELVIPPEGGPVYLAQSWVDNQLAD